MTDYFRKFVHSEQAGGFLLLICTIIALTLANSEFANFFNGIWDQEAGFFAGSFKMRMSLRHWVDDGLMAVFFLLMGLEIKREVVSGELSSFKKAMLPGLAALGGMIVPALLFTAFNLGTETQSGWGIPMATDIAFSLAVLSLIKGVPRTLRIFLVTLAVADDIGAIVVIAVFYSNAIQALYLGAALIVVLILLAMNKKGILKLSYYLILGAALWLLILKSGIHATIAGVLLAFTIPYDSNDTSSPLHRLISVLHTPVNFLILPLFALANTGIVLEADFLGSLKSSDSLGILTGLVLGKPIGILSTVFLAVKLRLAKLPSSIKLSDFIGIGFLCGIGYTMSIFIAGLAYEEQALIESSKISVLTASLISALLGLMYLSVKYYGKRKAAVQGQQ